MNTSEAEAELEFEPWQGWEEPGFAEAPEAAGHRNELRPPTAQELEVLRQSAHLEGLAAGRNEGLRQGAEEVRGQLEVLSSLIGALARPLEQLDARVEEELVALTITLVRQLVRREVRTEPGVIVAAVREALAVLPLSAREIVIKVHPEDAALLRELYPEQAVADGPGWRLMESPAIARGGCVVVTSTSEVDATIERRLAAAIRHVFGGDRPADPPADPEWDPEPDLDAAPPPAGGPEVPDEGTLALDP
jgi:flagellar assembly protein FliH